jgi:hypothetical protein
VPTDHGTSCFEFDLLGMAHPVTSGLIRSN